MESTTKEYYVQHGTMISVRLQVYITFIINFTAGGFMGQR